MADLFKGLVEASPAGAMASGVAGAGIPGFKDVSGLA